MADIERDCPEFYALTGFLPPGKDESPAAVVRPHYERYEVRRKLWELYCKLKAKIERMDNESESAYQDGFEAGVEAAQEGDE